MCQEYIKNAHRTLSDGWYASTQPRAAVVEHLRGVVMHANRLDAVKKRVFYGKGGSDLPVGQSFSTVSLAVDTPSGKSRDSRRLIHGLVGIITEAGEIAEALVGPSRLEGPLDINNIKEELGDVFWYLAITCEALGVSFEDIQAMNIAKLRARYPEKFEKKQALHRDLAAEKQAMVAK